MASSDSLLSRIAERSCAWSERWIPDPFAVTVLVVAVVAFGALAIGVEPIVVARNFGEGFWSLIPFTMQMSFIIVGGYVTADSPPVTRLIQYIASFPKNGRAAVVMVAVFSMVLSLIHWGLCIVVASLLTRALARRTELNMDYRAAGAGAYLGIGSVWALGLSSSAAQLQANPASMPPSLLAVTGVIPFSETIFLWQSMLLAAILIAVSTWTAWSTVPKGAQVRTAEQLGIDLQQGVQKLPVRSRPGEWLEYSPVLTIFVCLLAVGWLVQQLTRSGVMLTISSLNNYNFIFLMLGLALHVRPRHFLDSAARSMSAVASVLIQFPMLGAIAMIMTTAKNGEGGTVADQLSHIFNQLAAGPAFTFVVGIYSAVLGMLIPSGGGKWVVEAPYVMQVANDVQQHLGWVVQTYNAAEALPNLINPFWMLPVLGILGLKARDLIGFTFIQFIVNFPIVLILLWLLGMTLDYTPPVMP
jgi:short-chain fatty acids transporter